MSETDIAWAAGLFEGEGTFSPRRQQTNWRTRLEMQMTSTDLDVLERFAEIAGFGNIRRRKDRPDRKPQWTWCSSTAKTIDLALDLRPYLGQRRKARLDEILKSIADSQPKTRPCECCDRAFMPTRFNRERFCSDDCRYRARYLRRVYRTTSLQLARSRGYCPGHIRDTDPGGRLIRAIR